MEKRLKDYLYYLRDHFKEDMLQEEKKVFKEDLLIQIGFFQHERLVHLVVTITISILSVLSIFCSFFYQNIGLYLLILLLMILLIPYIRHYYILENGVQKLYGYYDRLIVE